MNVLRREFSTRLLKSLAAVCLLGAAGCSGGGPLSSEPKKYEGGGPLPEFTGEEIPDEPAPKSKTKAKRR